MSQDDPTPDNLYQDRWTVQSGAQDSAQSGDSEPPLPHVEPPSAGFIVQLFVVPAVIVAVVIGVYLLFGRLAAGEADWRQLVTDVQSENVHVRWRSALTLAQVLQDDSLRKDRGQHLARNPEIATALANLLAEHLKKTAPNEEELQQTDYLLKAVGLLDVPETVVPVLLVGTEISRDREIRKQALNSLALVCGRAYEIVKKPVDMPELTDRIVEVSKESEPLSRHQAAYILGTLTTATARERLAGLLDDSDQMARLNAAVGFARQKSLQGLPVFEQLFRDAADWTLDPSAVRGKEQETQHFERVLLISNAMAAIQNLAPQLDATQKSNLLTLVTPIADRATDISVQKQWAATRKAIAP
jgi:hypothetical protein